MTKKEGGIIRIEEQADVALKSVLDEYQKQAEKEATGQDYIGVNNISDPYVGPKTRLKAFF